MSDIEDVLIVGSGFAGLCAAIKLKEAGFGFVILEKADSLGGTWRDNDYPGCQCDVESHFYSFSFAPNPKFTRKFAPQGEILAYMREVADRYGIADRVRYGIEVERATFDEGRGIWTVTSKGGETFRARFVVSGTGGLSRPALPAIEGLSSFAGEVFHSARWKHDVPLEGKSVAVIGTGASAIQIVPSIAPKVRKLSVFQRTPPWIIPRPDRAIGARERELYAKVPLTLKLARASLYARRELFFYGFVSGSPLGKVAERLARRHLAKSVHDPALRERLTPRYAIGCKRILLSNDYYQAFARDNVELVTDPIARVVPEGIEAGGATRKVDVLVLATGFQAAESVAPFEVRGRGGVDLAKQWEPGAEAYLGTTVAGFPNLFTIVGPNTGLGHGSMIFMIEAQVAYVVDAIKAVDARGPAFLDVLPEVQRRYNEEIQARLAKRVWATGGCTSWYQTSTGKNTTLWPDTMVGFERTLRFDPSAFEIVELSRSARREGRPSANDELRLDPEVVR